MVNVVRLTQESAERYMRGRVACPRCGKPMHEQDAIAGSLCRGCGQSRRTYMKVGRAQASIIAKAEAWHVCYDCDQGINHRSRCTNCAEARLWQ